MCKIFLPVTQDYQGRAFYRCEHGTFHLQWNRSTLHMTEGEVKYLFSFFSQGNAPYEAPYPSMRNIRLYPRVSHDGSTFFELWVWDSGIRFSVMELEILKKLVYETVVWLDKQSQKKNTDSIPGALDAAVLKNLKQQTAVEAVYLN